MAHLHWKALPILFATLLLAACGFQLRGSDALPAELQPLYIGGTSAYSGFGMALRQEFNLRGVVLSPTLADARYQLHVLEHEQEQRTLSFDPRAYSGELSLTERVHFELRDSRGVAVLGPITLEERRIMVDDPDRRVDKDSEAGTLRDEMLSGLASQLLRHLQAYSANLPPTVQAD